MSVDKEKIILKTDRLEGVDKSIYDYTQLQTVPIVQTRVSKSMYKRGRHTFLGIKERTNVGDVIRVGDFRILYRVIKLVRMEVHGGIYKILRVDGSNTTQLDLDGARKGKRVVNLRMKESFLKSCRKCKEC